MGGIAMEEFKMAYGDQEISFKLPAEKLLATLYPKKLPSPEDEEELVRQALADPIGTPPLREIVKPGETVCIVVGDMTRLWVRHQVLLIPILEELNKAGIPDEKIVIVSATGSHRKQTVEEHKELVGSEIYDRVTVVDHQAEAKDLVDYGKTSRGTPIMINRQVAEADRVIITGGIVYHFLAGYGGGKKAIMPGVANVAGIMANHKLALNPDGPGLNSEVCAAKLDGNPLSEDMIEATRIVGVDLMVNSIINNEHKVGLVVAGDLEAAHKEGCALVDKYFGVDITKQADLVVASCGGFPKDINLYQSYKTVHNMVPALKKGGVGIILAECREGIGNDFFYTICKDYKSNEEREKALRENFQIASFMGYTQLRWAQECHLILISSLSEQQVKEMGMIPASSLEKAISLAMQWLPKNYNFYVMPEGSTTYPFIR